MANPHTEDSEVVSFKSKRTKALSESIIADQHLSSEFRSATNSLPLLNQSESSSSSVYCSSINNIVPMLHPALPNPFSSSPSQRSHPSVIPNLYPGLTTPQSQSAWSQFLPFYNNYASNLLPGSSQHNIDQIAMALMKPSRGVGPGHNPGMFNAAASIMKPNVSYGSGLPTQLPSGAAQLSIDHSARLFQHGLLSGLPGSSGVRFPPSGPNTLSHFSLFQKGTPIRLASGEIRPVEEMRTDDFYKNIERYPNQRVEKSTVRRIDKNYSTGKATIEFQIRNKMVIHETLLAIPFYVVDGGWSSCDPEKSLQMFNIQCNKLEVDDHCLVRLEVGKSTDCSSLNQVKIPEQELSKFNPFNMPGPIPYPKCTEILMSPHNKLNNRRQLLEPYARTLPPRKSDCQVEHHSAFSPPTSLHFSTTTSKQSTACESPLVSSTSSNSKSNSFSVAQLMQGSEKDA